jgi:hypothetical protein
MIGSESALTSTSPKALRNLEAIVIKPPNDAQLTWNNNLGLLIANSTQPEAALSLLASWHLSDAICVKPEALMTDHPE